MTSGADRTELRRRYEERLQLRVPAELAALQGLSLFAGIPEKARDKVLEKVRKYMHFAAYRRGDVVLREGDYGDSAYYVVKGSVRVGAGRIRITVQLVDAHGETHRWAHGYDRAATDCPVQIQTDVAADIARGLDRHLTPVPSAVAASAVAASLDAVAALGAGAAA